MQIERARWFFEKYVRNEDRTPKNSVLWNLFDDKVAFKNFIKVSHKFFIFSFNIFSERRSPMTHKTSTILCMNETFLTWSCPQSTLICQGMEKTNFFNLRQNQYFSTLTTDLMTLWFMIFFCMLSLLSLSFCIVINISISIFTLSFFAIIIFSIIIFRLCFIISINFQSYNIL